MIENEDVKLIVELTENSEKEEVKLLNAKCKDILTLIDLQSKLKEIQEKLSSYSKDEKEN